MTPYLLNKITWLHAVKGGEKPRGEVERFGKRHVRVVFFLFIVVIIRAYFLIFMGHVF
jgi:hypothetical protein